MKQARSWDHVCDEIRAKVRQELLEVAWRNRSPHEWKRRAGNDEAEIEPEPTEQEAA